MNTKTQAHVFVFGNDMSLLKQSKITLELPHKISNTIASHYGRIRIDGKRYYFRGTISIHFKSGEYYIALMLNGENLHTQYNQKVFDAVNSML